MQLLPCSLSFTLAAVSILPGLCLAVCMQNMKEAQMTNTDLHQMSNALSCGLNASTIESTQSRVGPAFVGNPVSANPLRPKVEFNPRSAELHMDGGNTNTVDYPGPLGHNLNITSIDTQYVIFYWDSKGTMFAVYGGPCNGSNATQAIAVVDPDDMSFETLWEPPAKYSNTTINTTYMQLLMDTDQIVVSAMQGQIYVLQSCRDANGTYSIELQRLIDLTPSGVLKGNILLNSVMDSAGNVWFTTGAVDGVGNAQTTRETIVGYVEQDGTIHSLEIPNQSIGNGVSVTNTTIFINTEPSAADVHVNAVGFISALQPGPGTSVHVVWNATYDAGSSAKSGAFGTRGSGTTPTLLGNDFVAICDNADVQINLLIYPRNGTGNSAEPICKLPLFRPNASWTDNGVMGYFDGKDYAVVVQNMDHEAKYSAVHKDINGPYNNLSSQSPGIWKFHVAGDGSGCHLQWKNPGRMTTVPILSTSTGLIYGYEQAEQLANEGNYVWYATATDFDSGETVWKARTGAGGLFNNYFRTTFASPDGTLYQMVQGGVVIIKDGEH